MKLMPILLNVETAGKLLGVSKSTIWDMVRTGDLRAIRMGKRCTRILLDDVQAFVDKNLQAERPQ